MTTKSTAPVRTDLDEIDISLLMQLFWRRKFLILAITLGFAIVVSFIAYMLPDVYRAEALVTQQDRSRMAGNSALFDQYSGLASLAGINLTSGRGDELYLGLEVLKSRRFISEFIERHRLLVPLMASKGWRDDNAELIIDQKIYDEETDTWVRRVRPPRRPKPSKQEAYEAFTEILSVRHDDKTGLVQISIDHYSPNLAKKWVDWLIQDLNSEILERDMLKAEQAISFLTEKIETTPLTGLREVFFRLIEEQTKIVMLAEISDEYLLTTIDPAFVPEDRHRPNRILIVLLGISAGFLLALLLVAFMETNRIRLATRPD